jgi:tetratricopeptide (TPR) repeat protein
MEFQLQFCKIMQEEVTESDILVRAQRAINDDDFTYAKFLYREALVINPQDIAARTAMHELRRKSSVSTSLFDGIRFVFFAIKLLICKANGSYDQVINAAEKLLDINPASEFALRNILYAAYGAGYHKLAIFVSQKVMAAGAELEDLVVIAHSYLNEKIFDQAAKIAKEAMELDPANEEAKDILWKSSIEKHMNSNVSLVTADGNKRFVPPKVDADKIFIASPSSHEEQGKKNSNKR